MAELDAAAARALAEAQDLVAESEEARVRLAAVRERLLDTSQRMEAGWARLLARGQTLLEQVESDQGELASGRVPSEDALDHLRSALEELGSTAVSEAQTTRDEFEELAAAAEAHGPELSGALAVAAEAEASLRSRLAEMETELEAALTDAELELTVDLSAEMKAFESEVERATMELQGFLAGECLPALAAAGRDLFDALVRTEDDLRAEVDAAGASVEASADDTLRACNQGHDEALSELEARGEAVAGALAGLDDFVRESTSELREAQERGQDEVRGVAEALRAARQAIREVEELLSRFSFVRL